MSEKFTLPRSLNSAVRDLNGLGALLTATQWKRAAYVSAFTVKGRPGPGDRGDVIAISVKEFTRLKIHGLTGEQAVRAYRDAWAKAVKAGLVADVRPGQTVVLPDAPWEDYFEARPEPFNERYVKATPEAIEKAIDEKPEVREAAAKAVTKHKATRTRIAREALADKDTAKEIMRDPKAREDAYEGVNQAAREDHDRRHPDRKWEPEAVSGGGAQDGAPTNMEQVGMTLGLLVEIGRARRAIRGVTRTLEASHAIPSKEVVEESTNQLAALEADIGMLRALLTGRVNEDELAAFLASGD